MRRGVLIVLTLLSVLISIGLSAAVAPASIGNWGQVAPLSVPRTGAAAALLSDGRVLVIGGLDAGGLTLNTTDFVNPDGTVTPGPALNVGRSGHTATFIAGNLVLVAGGNTADGATNSAELFDATANTWTLLSTTLNDARSGHAAFVLPDSTVAILGGNNGSTAVASVELFNPLSRQFTYMGVLNTPRTSPAIAALSDGRLLVAGGSDASGATLATTEIFDPLTGFSTSGPSLTTPRSGASATTLVDGRVAVIGGSYPEGAQNGVAELASVELIDATLGVDTVSPVTLTTARTGQLANLLPDNNAVLITAGSNAGNPLSSAELFLPWSGALIDSATAAQHQGGAVAAGSGVLTLAGGSNLATVEQYGYATLKSDNSDYQPGQPVTVTGSGWQPGETVTLTMVQTPVVDGDVTYQVTADANGNIVNSDYYAPTTSDIGARYTLTAVGSKSQAQIRFADAGAPYQLAFSNAARAVVPGQCSTAIIIQSQDVTGTASKVSTATTVSLRSTSSTGTFYTSSTCTAGTETTTAQIAATASAVDVYYTDTVVGSPVISAAETSGQLYNGANLLSPTPQTETVNQGTTTTTLTSDQTGNTISYGSTVNFTVTVTAKSPATGTPTGTVTIQRGGVVYGTVNLSSGSGTIAISTLAGPGGNFTATYSSDSNYKASTSTAVAITVTKDTSTPVLVSSASPSAYGDSVTFTATAQAVGGGDAPTGTVTFKDGTKTLGTAAPTNGVATFSTSTTLILGGHSITAAFAADTNYNAATSSALTQTVGQKALTVSGIGASDKPYDGATGATLTGTPGTLVGVVGSDVVSLSGTAVGTFISKNAGSGVQVLVAGQSLTGANAGNYTLSEPTTMANITARAITVTAAANNKPYDGSTSAVAVPTITGGTLASGDTPSFTEAYASKNVGTSLTLTPSGSVNDGNNGANYSVTFANNTTGAITATPITITAAANNKPYDGTTSAAAAPAITSGALASGDTLNFTEAYTSKNVGTGLTLTPAGSVIDGNNGGNYSVTFVNNVMGTITQRDASVTADAASATYGSTDPVLSGTLSGFIPADNVTATYMRTPGVYVDGGPYVVSATLSPTNVLSNYNITYHTASFSILPASLSVTVSPSSYSRAVGAANPSFTGTVLGAMNNDVNAGNLVINYITTAGTSSPVGSYPITATLSGAAAASYTLNATPGTLSVWAQGVDLIEPSVSVSGTPASGGTILVTDTTQNQGLQAAGASYTMIYLSSDGKTKGSMLTYRSVGALAAGASSSATSSMTLPANVTGTNYVLVCANGSNSPIAETNTTNDCTASAAFTVAGPDLIESSVTGPTSGVAGGTISVTDTTTNQGGGATGASYTMFYLSSDGKTKGAMLTYRSVAALAAGANSGATTSMTLPANITGTNYVLVCANGSNSPVVETNTTNDCMASAAFNVGGADLIESSVTGPTTGVAGGTISVTDTTTNQGGGATGASYTMFYLSSDGKTQGSMLTYRSVAGLAAGASSSATTSMVLPANITGTNYVLVCANGGNSPIAETNTTNNCTASAAFTVAGADLIESSVSGPTSGVAGGTISVTDTTTNQGGGAAGASYTMIYLSSDGKTKGSMLTYRSVGALAAGASSSATSSMTLPANVTGTNYLLVCANGSNSPIAETNTTNDCTASAAFTVAGPDLIESSVTAPTTGVAGGTISVTDTTTNQGGGATSASYTMFYLSSDGKTKGSMLTYRSVAALAAGANSGATTSMTLPANITGTSYVLVCANGSNSPVVETNTTNDCTASAAFTVTN